MSNKPDIETAEKHIRLALSSLGLTCESGDMEGTPRRVAKHWACIAKNYGRAPTVATSEDYNPDEQIKLTTFDAAGVRAVNELVVMRNMEYSSHCAHHLLPFFGTACIGYLPNGSIIGASKIPRLLKFFAERPQTQEYLTDELADYIARVTGARFVGVVLTGKHTCCSCRGVHSIGSEMVTSAFRKSHPQDNIETTKQEFLRLRVAGPI